MSNRWCFRLIFALMLSTASGRLVNSKRTFRTKMRYEAKLDDKGELVLHWDVNAKTETIRFRLDARMNTNDVLGFGFSDYGDVKNADFAVMWTDNRGKHHFQDAHTDDKGLLLKDKHQDYRLQRVRAPPGGYMQFWFERLYDTCDKQDYAIDEGTTHMIFFRAEPGNVIGLNVSLLHPGLQRVQLRKSELPDAELPSDTRTFVTHVTNVTVPAADTTYWCSVTKLPDLPENHHIVRYAGAIEPNNLVHHLEVFHCEVPIGKDVEPYNAPCNLMANRPSSLDSCRHVIGAWAIGAPPYSYPKEAGVLIGGKDYSSYVMLEVHYNNPKLVQGVVDSSGIKFYVTKQLRKYNAGIMELGQEYTDKVALPPGLEKWNLDGYCTPDCTRVGLPTKGIRIFASQLHTHLTGRRAYTKHYRRGRELAELARDNHYSPHYQEIRKLKRQVKVLPGDALITTCEDNTMDRKAVTLGGFSTSDEMCVNYVHYYPKVNLEVCKSSVTTDSLYSFFRFLKYYQGEPTSDALGISDNYKAIHWTDDNTRMLRTFYDSAPLSMQCNQSDGTRFPGSWEGNKIPRIRFRLPEPENPCLTPVGL